MWYVTVKFFVLHSIHKVCKEGVDKVTKSSMVLLCSQPPPHAGSPFVLSAACPLPTSSTHRTPVPPLAAPWPVRTPAPTVATFAPEGRLPELLLRARKARAQFTAHVSLVFMGWAVADMVDSLCRPRTARASASGWPHRPQVLLQYSANILEELCSYNL